MKSTTLSMNKNQYGAELRINLKDYLLKYFTPPLKNNNCPSIRLRKRVQHETSFRIHLVLF